MNEFWKSTLLNNKSYKPLFRSNTQQPSIRFEAFSAKSRSTRSENLILLYCKRCLKSTAGACKTCFVMCGRINGNPSDDIRNKHDAAVPSFEVCRSWKVRKKKYIQYETIKKKNKLMKTCQNMGRSLLLFSFN